MGNFKIIKREVITEFGTEIAVIKKYNLDKEQWKNRIWVFQPQDKEFQYLKEQMEVRGLWEK